MEKKERLTEGYKYVHRDASCPFFLHFPRFSSFPSFFSFLLVFFSLFSLLFPLKCIRGVASDSFSSPHLSKGEGGGDILALYSPLPMGVKLWSHPVANYILHAFVFVYFCPTQRIFFVGLTGPSEFQELPWTNSWFGPGTLYEMVFHYGLSAVLCLLLC